MLGFRFKKPSYQKSTDTVSSASPIMISNFIGTTNTTSRTSTSLMNEVTKNTRISGDIITIPLMSRFLTKNRTLEKSFNDSIIGRCDGEFPVTNPIEGNIYYNSQDKKYYKCINSFTGSVETPDNKFRVLSLDELSSSTGGASTVVISGDIAGSGNLSSDGKTINVTTTLSKLIGYTKGIYSNIVETDSATIAIGKLEGALDNKANVSGSYPNLHSGSASKVTNKLSISMNGSNTIMFDGSGAVAIDITASKIGASPSVHNHDGVYQPIGDYSEVGHKHTAEEVSGLPTSLPNPYALNIRLGSSTYTYNGSSTKEVVITPSSIGAQPAGDYADKNHSHTEYSLTSHNHDTTYSKNGHKHGNSDITDLDASKITSGVIDIARLPAAALERLIEVENDDARFALTKSEVQNGDTVKVTETLKMYRVVNDTKLSTEEGYTVYVAGRAAEVPWSGVTGKPSTFTPSVHTHATSEITNFPSSMKNPYALSIQLNGGTANVYDGSSAKTLNITPASIGAQVAGSYALSNHNHSGVYAPVSHTHTIDQIGKLTGYVKASTAAAIDVTDSILIALGKLEKALDGKQASGSYAPSSHTHTKSQITDFPTSMKNPNAITISLNGVSQGAYDGSAKKSINITPASIGAQVAGSYAAASHTHGWDTISGKPSTFTPSGHNQASSTINVLTGYTKPTSTSAISATDSLNAALGKLEKALDGKQASGSYAAASHSHSWGSITSKPSSFTPSAHNQASNTITAMTGYSKATAVAAISTSDSLNVAIGKLEKALDSKQAAGSYALSDHNHSGVYAPVSHGTHVTYATATPLAPGSASVGTSAKVAREDHVHPLQTSVSGNAGSATVLATARTINGTSFNGSANITTARWGTARTLTIGNSGKSVNGSANVTWTLNEIGAARGYEVSGTTAATAKWYRIAQSGSDIGNNIGLFLIQAAVSGKHSSTLLSAGISYGTATLNLDQLSHNSYNGADGISKVRIVYHGTYAGNKAYLEVYVPDAAARTIKVQMLGGNLGWTLVTPSTAGSIPSGYTSKEITLYDSKIVSYGGFVGSLSGNASTASALATARTITLTGDVTGSVSFNGSANVSITTTVGDDSHSHSWGNITGKPSTFTPSGHNQASNTITAMRGYAKASAVAAIATTDSLNVAIGKLEKALDGKQAAGSYAAASHNHDSVYAKTSHGNHVPATQTASNKVFLRNDNTWQTITPANIGAAAASHTHSYLPTSGGTISGALTVTGQILSNADVVAYSDKRFKTNLKVIENPIEKLNKISGYHYQMLGVPNSNQVGVVAQEVEEVLPEAVYKDENGYYGVRYTNLIPLLIEAVKSHEKTIKELRQEIYKLKGGAN